MRALVYPFEERIVRQLRVGEAVSISGIIHTGRDRFHKFFAEGGTIPVDFKNGALYHCGPVVVEQKGKWKVMAAGPTTSVRENPYEPEFIAKSGVRVIIGKGGMDGETLRAMKKCGCVYIQAVGGAAAISAAAVKRVRGVDFLKEFGAAEACWHFEVEDFRGIVAMDATGASLFNQVARRSQSRFATLINQNS